MSIFSFIRFLAVYIPIGSDGMAWCLQKWTKSKYDKWKQKQKPNPIHLLNITKIDMKQIKGILHGFKVHVNMPEKLDLDETFYLAWLFCLAFAQ